MITEADEEEGGLTTPEPFPETHLWRMGLWSLLSEPVIGFEPMARCLQGSRSDP